MNMGDISTFISTVGFPIAAFLLMWVEMRDERKARNDETEKTTTAYNNLTKALQELTDMVKELSNEHT